MGSEDKKMPDNKVNGSDKTGISDEALSGVSGGGQRKVTRPLIDSFTKRILIQDNIDEVDND